MNLLFFISSLRAGGAERVLATIANALVGRGHSISVVYDQQLPCQYDLDMRIHKIDMSQLMPKVGSKLYRNLLFLYNIRRLVKKHNPDVVISFMFSLNVKVLLSLIFSGYPTIASEHTRFQNLKESDIKRYISRYWINKLAKKVTILTQRDYNFIGHRLSNKVVLPNPLSFPPIEQVRQRPNKILACGSLDRYKEKGFDTLIQIFGMIASKHSDWSLDILGTGCNEAKQSIYQLIKENCLECQVHLLGYSNDVASIMKEHAIFVLSSQFEGLPMALMEAMSQGCACISYDCVCGPKEIICHNVDGLLIEDQNKEKLKEGIEYLISHPEERSRLAQNAIQNIQRYSVDKIVDQWEMLLKQCV